MKYRILIQFTLIPILFSYSQTAEEFYVRAMEFKKNGNNKDLKKIINLLQKSVTVDDNFIEAHFQLAETFMDWELKKSKTIEAKKHYDKCINLLEKGIRLRSIDGLTERSIYRSVAFAYCNFYNLNVDDKEEYYEKAIQLYKKALEFPYYSTEPQDLFFPDFDSDKEIKKAIAQCYEDLARIEKFNKHYISAMGHLYDAKYLYEEIKYYDFIFEKINKEIAINNLLYQNDNWEVFTTESYTKLAPKMYYQKELIGANNFLYFYNQESIEKLPNNIIRVWLLSANLTPKENLNNKDEYKKKILAEFDVKNKKYRHLKYLSYNKNNIVLNDYSDENSKWDFIAPDTIYEKVVNYFNKKSKNK